MNVQPIRDFVSVTKDEDDKEKKSPAGLFIATLTEEKVGTGTVAAVGGGRVSMNGTVVPLDVKVGDRVAFNRNLLVEVKVGNESAFLLREDQILCKLV